MKNKKREKSQFGALKLMICMEFGEGSDHKILLYATLPYISVRYCFHGGCLNIGKHRILNSLATHFRTRVIYNKILIEYIRDIYERDETWIMKRSSLTVVVLLKITRQ